MRKLTALKLVVFALCLLGAADVRAEAGGLEKLELNKDFPSGCGCSVTDAKDQFLVSTDLETMDLQGKTTYPPAVVKIGGKRLQLSFVSTTEKPAAAKLGDKFTRVYEKDGVRLTLNFKTVFVCPPKSEECEVIRYTVDGLLKNGEKTTTLSGLKGDCGC